MALGGMVKAITHPVTMECCGLDMKSNIEPVFYGTTMTEKDLEKFYLSKGPGGCDDHTPMQLSERDETNSEHGG